MVSKETGLIRALCTELSKKWPTYLELAMEAAEQQRHKLDYCVTHPSKSVGRRCPLPPPPPPPPPRIDAHDGTQGLVLNSAKLEFHDNGRQQQGAGRGGGWIFDIVSPTTFSCERLGECSDILEGEGSSLIVVVFNGVVL